MMRAESSGPGGARHAALETNLEEPFQGLTNGFPSVAACKDSSYCMTFFHLDPAKVEIYFNLFLEITPLPFVPLWRSGFA